MTPNKSIKPTSTLVNRVREALKHVPGVDEKKMFGGTAFMIRGKICVSARAERIMCRIDPSLHDAVLDREGCRTMVMKGREYRGYVYVGAEFVKTKPALKYWVDLALSYNKAISSTVRRKTSAR